jgi:glutamine synthetase
VAKEIGFRNNIYTTFMPKPLSDQNGSGMHIHMSLFEGETNIFFDEKAPHNLSKNARHFIAGLLRHCNEFFAVTNQWINSYKRLLFGFESPTHISWGYGDYTDLVRVPQFRPGKSSSARIEIRNPDSAINPYLVFSAILASGIKGIDEQYELPDPVELRQPVRSRRELQKLGLKPVPAELYEAVQYLDGSALMRGTLGDFVVDRIVENKILEIEKYNAYITDFEINEYFHIL